MIDPKELRIGNWVWENYGGYAQVDGIRWMGKGTPQDVQFSRRGGATGQISAEDCYPVVIHPEMLVNAGFEPHMDDGSYKIGIFHLHHYRLDDSYCASFQHSRSEAFKHLHQLQNLYYAWTQEELLVKL